MTRKSTLTYLALGGMLLLPAIGMASSANQNETSDKSAKVRKITGCLAKGDSDNEYAVKAANGGRGEVRSEGTTSGENGGSTVTATGSANNATASGAKGKVKDKT